MEGWVRDCGDRVRGMSEILPKDFATEITEEKTIKNSVVFVVSVVDGFSLVSNNKPVTFHVFKHLIQCGR